MWYENFNKPETTWQSSGASDDAGSKYGLWPLVFGSLKGTVYCLLFGVPMAMLGAIFTSEFLNPRAKSIVKPTIEMMASPPSVVLGFLAALVIALVAEDFVPAVIASFVIIPSAFLCGAFIWQLLPYERTLRMGQWRWHTLEPALLSRVISRHGRPRLDGDSVSLERIADLAVRIDGWWFWLHPSLTMFCERLSS